MPKVTTIIEDGYLDHVLTNKGSSIADLSVKHNVLLMFLRHTNCWTCKETISDIAANYMSLLKYNTIPVLVHLESKKYFSEWLQKFAGDNDVIKNMLSVHDEKKHVSNAFKVKSGFPPLKHFPSAVARSSKNISDQDNLFGPEGVDFKTFPALFIIEKSKIVREFRHKVHSERADYLRILIDPDNAESPLDFELATKDNLECDGLYCAMPSKDADDALSPTPTTPKTPVLTVTDNKKKRLSCVMSPKDIEPEFDSANLTLEKVLLDKRMSKFFHLFVSREFAQENVMFWQEVNVKYKKTEDENKRRIIGDKIIKSFLNQDSILEINVSNTIKKEVVEVFMREGPLFEIFDEAVMDIQSQVLTHLFTRYCQSKLFKEMLGV
ncbi:hypothetical protein AKO1_007887 [Acrasis kona]|uniref:RGS domain-containing protein n=1 Tax=Acrasis kona TaxID=1008807 RepID=A0AAW2YPI5_9EUKA